MPSIFFILDEWNRFGGTPRKFEQLSSFLGPGIKRVEASSSTLINLLKQDGAMTIVTAFNRPLICALFIKLLKPKVNVIHNYVNLDKLRLLELCLRRIAELLDVQFVVPSKIVALQKGLTNYIVIANGVKFNTERTQQSQNHRLFTIGGLNHYKNHEVIIKALPYLKEYKLDIYGEGPLEEYLRNLSVSLGVNSRVYFHGYLDNDLISFNGIYIHSSISEGFGNAACEALGNGARFLLSDIDVNHELFDYQSAVFFNPCDVKDLVQKIDECCSLNAQELVCHKGKYSLSTFVTKWKNILLK